MVTIRLGTIKTETEGGNLLEILRRTPALAQAVGKIASPCGGWGTCGKCRIAVDAGAAVVSPVTEGEEKLLSRVKEDLPEGYVWRLACRCEVTEGEIGLWLPEEDKELGGAQAEESVQTETTPWIRWQEVSLTRPTLEDPVSVAENLQRSGLSGRITTAVHATGHSFQKPSTPCSVFGDFCGSICLRNGGTRSNPVRSASPTGSCPPY